MKEKIPPVAAGILGLAFVVFGALHFSGITPPPPPEGSPLALFFGGIGPTGYIDMVKALEIIGGVLVAIPRTRNFGLLVLGPIVVNILAVNAFLTDNAIISLIQPPVVLVSVLSAYLLWDARKKFLGLLS